MLLHVKFAHKMLTNLSQFYGNTMLQQAWYVCSKTGRRIVIYPVAVVRLQTPLSIPIRDIALRIVTIVYLDIL